jgi:predicted transcriptional regulator
MLAALADKNGEMKPTHLMYKSNLSHPQMQQYLQELSENGFITRVHKKDHDMVVLTDQGYKLLQKIEDMRNFQQGFGL